MKLIREARMGRPKTFKTGAVVGTYPKPMLYFGFDRGGLDVIPTKPVPDGYIPMDVTDKDIVRIRTTDIDKWLKEKEQPKVLAVDTTPDMPMTLDIGVKPSASQDQLLNFQACYNKIVQAQKAFPWKTLVVDSITGYTDACLSYISSYNPNAMADARQWAGQAGGLVRKLTLSITNMPCHVVLLLHSVTEVDENTKAISEQPSIYSQVLRDDFFGLFSQVFYAVKDATGNPVIWPSDKYPVKGIGPRWPLGLPKECKPDFMSIYGKEI